MMQQTRTSATRPATMGRKSSWASHQYWTPSSSLLELMLTVNVSLTGLFVDFLEEFLQDCTSPSVAPPL
ncbi:hypothetical protein CRUP_008763 [Coryphaenoides rupestris]|nr:hypothetical protein CRUP_008763 [Coryphaenoides rupestris]